MKKITTRILLMILAVELVGYASLVMFNRISSEGALLGVREEHLESIIEMSLQSINDRTHLLEHSVQNLAAAGEHFLRIKQDNPNYDVQPAVQKLLLSHFQGMPEILGGGLWYEPYVFYKEDRLFGPYVHRVSGKMEFTWELSSEKYNYPQQDWYLLAIQGMEPPERQDHGSVFWTAPYIDQAGSNAPMVTVDAIIYDRNGKFAGLSTLDWSLEEITKFISHLNITPRSQAFLIDPQSHTFLQKTESGTLPSIAESEWASGLHFDDATDDFRNIKGVKANDLENRVYYAQTDVGAIFGVLIPENDFFDTARKVSHANSTISIIIALVAVVCVFTILLLFFRGFRRILARFRDSVQKDPGSGEIMVQPIPYTANDEFRPVVDAFNEISQRIHVTHERLLQESKDRQGIQAELLYSHKKLIRAQKLESVGRMAGAVAHDFNNIITAILGHTELATQATSSGDSIVEDLQEIEKAGRRAEELTRQILTFSSQHEIALRPLNMNHLIVDVWNMLRQLASSTVALERDLQEDLDLVMLSVGQFDQILANFVVNASDAIPAGGTIRVSTANIQVDHPRQLSHCVLPSGTYATLKVADTGEGMPSEIREKIFEPFFTTKAINKGTGIGLSTVLEIVEHFRGTIDVQSEEGQGTTFTLYFPTTTTSGAAVLGPSEKTSTPESKAILVVDDDQLILNLESRILHSAGYTVRKANSGAEALLVLENHPDICLLISDIMMPDMNGPLLAELADEKFPKLRYLFVSGFTAGILGRLSPKETFLAKPFSPAEFLSKVKSILEKDIAQPDITTLRE